MDSEKKWMLIGFIAMVGWGLFAGAMFVNTTKKCPAIAAPAGQ